MTPQDVWDTLCENRSELFKNFIHKFEQFVHFWDLLWKQVQFLTQNLQSSEEQIKGHKTLSFWDDIFEEDIVTGFEHRCSINHKGEFWEILEARGA